MKKTLLILLTLTTMASTAFAAAPLSKLELGHYYSKQHPRTPGMNAASMYPATDITVVNATVGVIYTVVPNSPIYDVNSPETNDHVRHDSLMGPTHIHLQDPYGNAFFDNYVCRLAVITTFGFPGSYRVNVDEEYCYRP